MHTSRSRLQRAFAAVLTVTCLFGTAGCRPRLSESDPVETVPMVFANETMERATVFVGTEGESARRVGVVLGGETATLRVPRRFYENGRMNVWAELRRSPRTPWLELRDLRSDEELRVRLPRTGPQLVAIR